MFIAVYRFDVKKGFEAEFQNAWHDGTNVIYKRLGSLGSRLHLSEKGEWIAYAVWPSKEVFDQEWVFTEAEKEIVSAFRQFCTGAELLYRLDVVDDLIRTQPHQP
ncbi:MAG TPA: antibiotic biosynthesis monooxygenase [Bdellovibrionota bacterium]|jgi:hypothetical protein|nr:antibiotic biosynthesis monooxygenase [Bdellovibrionota bacterium]